MLNKILNFLSLKARLLCKTGRVLQKILNSLSLPKLGYFAKLDE